MHKLIKIVGCLTAVVGTIFLVLVAIILILGSYLRDLKYPDVKEEALEGARNILTELRFTPVGQPATSDPSHFDDCKIFLREEIATYGDQYSLEVIAAFDANDPDYATEGISPPVGSRDAEVLVQFPDGQGVIMYFYNGFWEMCYANPGTPTPPETPAG